MKKIVSVVLVVLMSVMVGLPALAVSDGANVMDTPAEWAIDEVDLAIRENLIPEDMQNNYTKSVTREEFCILAIRMIEARSGMTIDEYLSAVGTELAPITSFEDCDTKEVLASKALGITDGTSPTTFEPGRLLTRQEAAKFLTTTAIACGQVVSLSTPAYSDVEAIASWAQPYTGYVYDIDVMKGVGNNKFDPTSSYQRQQAMMTMYRIWKAIELVNIDNVILPDEEDVARSTWFMGQDFSDPELADLLTVLEDTFKTAPFNLMMEDNNSMNIELNYMADEMTFATTTKSERYDFNNNRVEIVEFYDGSNFNTVVHELKTVKRYSNSVNDKKFFDFGTRTAYVDKKVNGTYVTFTFRDLGMPGLSGMSTYYDYDVNMAYNKLLEISVYLKESDDSTEEYAGNRYGFNAPWYGYTDMDQIPEDYTVLEGGFFYDGESYPFWYMTE